MDFDVKKLSRWFREPSCLLPILFCDSLKYANRARNIKNRAVLNEKEDGWEEVGWLQGAFTRLCGKGGN
jgi:hypothetical protein